MAGVGHLLLSGEVFRLHHIGLFIITNKLYRVQLLGEHSEATVIETGRRKLHAVFKRKGGEKHSFPVIAHPCSRPTEVIELGCNGCIFTAKKLPFHAPEKL